MSSISVKRHEESIDEAIRLLGLYVKDSAIEPLFAILEELKQDQNNASSLEKLSEQLNNIGVLKGAVLTYAPYISVLVSKDLFSDD